MLKSHQFFQLLGGLVETLPHAKSLSERGLAFAWSSWPAAAKDTLSLDHLSYACTQRTLDPEPNLKLAIHIQLLTYVYPLRDGIPFFETGLRSDIERRMRHPFVFHPLTATETHQAPRLPPVPIEPPKFQTETPEQRRSRLKLIAGQVRAKDR